MYTIIGVLFWYIGRKMDSWDLIQQKIKSQWKVLIPWSVAFIGALTFSLGAVAEKIAWAFSTAADFASMIINSFGASVSANLLLVAFGILLTFFLVKGLSDASLDKRDIFATAMLPIVALPMGGVIGDLFATARTSGADIAMSVVTTLGG